MAERTAQFALREDGVVAEDVSNAWDKQHETSRRRIEEVP